MASSYDFGKIEKKWRAAWDKEGVYEPKLKGAGGSRASGGAARGKKRTPFYNLMMFPYPSAEGLHVGNMYAFTGADVYGRFMRMHGHDVFEPIGLDGFGIHSENYAMKVGTHPMKQAPISEKRFYEQLRMIGNGFAWKEHVETYDPEYYKWTQWIFTKLFAAGLAYRKKQAVNWCPHDQTVLADEQVEDGKCERCGAVVEKRELEQWFFRITKYAERLLANTEKLDWTEKVRIAQRNWIGKSEGAILKFAVPPHDIEVFTTRPETVFGATFVVVSPELAQQWLTIGWPASAEVKEYIKKSLKRSEADRLDERAGKTGVAAGFGAVNPATKEEIPVWIADYVLGGYGTGAIMAVPAHDERDFEFAKKYQLPIRVVIEPTSASTGGYDVHKDQIIKGELCYPAKEGFLINSGEFDLVYIKEAAVKIANKFGRPVTQYKLRDWLISRQRYWGPPIPMIFCEACATAGKGQQKEMPGWYAVPEKDLPVKLPNVKEFRPQGTGTSPLASVKSFYEAKCPACRAKARRETDVSDTFLDSAWYQLRYPNANDKKRAWDPAIIKKWFPVDMYIGGAEHSVLHLLYVRFLSLALHDMKLLNFPPAKNGAPHGEPFPTFRAHGLIIKEGAKMSKSKGNVVNPDEYIQRYGADTLRMYLMFLAPFEQGGDFRDQAVVGVARFLERVWKFVNAPDAPAKKDSAPSGPENKAIQQTIKKVTGDIADLHYNTAISALMICLNALEEQNAGGIAAAGGAGVARATKEHFVKLLAPFAPYIAEELWRGPLKHKTSVHREAWPEYDASAVVEDTIKLIVQVNGKVRTAIEVPATIVEEEAKARALEDPKVQALLEGQVPQRIIYVSGRLVNIVI